MYTSQPVDIHIVCDEEAEKTLRAGLDLVKRPRHHIRISLHKMTFQSLLDRLEREGTLQTDHSAGIRKLYISSHRFVQASHSRVDEVIPP